MTEQYSDSNIRQVIRHSAKRILLAGKSAVVKYAYDGNKLYAIYDSGDGQRAVYEVQVELKSLPTTEPEPPKASCPTRLMDGRNEIRCWLPAGHEGDCK